MHEKLTLIIVGVAMLVGCADAGTHQVPRYLHEVPTGTHLTLAKPLPFEPKSLRIFLQDGKVANDLGFFGFKGIDTYRPYCRFELAQKAAEARTVEPQEYVMDSVSWESMPGEFNMAHFRTQWRLSGGNPPAWAFTCYKNDSGATGQPLTLEDVDHVVGGYFRLAPGSSPSADDKPAQ